MCSDWLWKLGQLKICLVDLNCYAVFLYTKVYDVFMNIFLIKLFVKIKQFVNLLSKFNFRVSYVCRHWRRQACVLTHRHNLGAATLVQFFYCLGPTAPWLTKMLTYYVIVIYVIVIYTLTREGQWLQTWIFNVLCYFHHVY